MLIEAVRVEPLQARGKGQCVATSVAGHLFKITQQLCAISLRAFGGGCHQVVYPQIVTVVEIDIEENPRQRDNVTCIVAHRELAITTRQHLGQKRHIFSFAQVGAQLVHHGIALAQLRLAFQFDYLQA